MQIDERKRKDEIIRMCVHDDWGNFQCTAVAREQKKRNSDVSNGVKMTALDVFRMKHNPAKEFAIEMVTKMHDIDCACRKELANERESHKINSTICLVCVHRWCSSTPMRC